MTSGIRKVIFGCHCHRRHEEIKNRQMADTNSFSEGVPSDSLEAAEETTSTMKKVTGQVMQSPRALVA